MNDFDEYKKQGEPEKKEKSEIWQTAIGLQQVDGLKPSQYLINTAKQNIDGDITFDEVKTRLNSYYKTKKIKTPADDRTEEADKVSANIAEILSEKTFNFSPAEYIAIHRRLFSGIYKQAGKIRDYNITKDEWVLNGQTVYYASADSIKATLDYDFSQEKAFNYKGLTKEQSVEHIAKFVSDIWQIHPFGEGNTRTTAVFAIKYLRTFGFTVNNDLFSEHSWYFRNALVRANYQNLEKDIHYAMEYLNRFFGNLLLGEKNILKNRDMQIIIKDSGTANDTVKSASDTVNDTVSDKILTLINKEPSVTATTLSEKTGLGIATVKRHIKKLKDGGFIERIGSDKAGYWKILK
ncbi:MAG: Fic family protein [Endomicrobia bacterium]|nr:Fic family protein [Endomicrobiia bacterium]